MGQALSPVAVPFGIVGIELNGLNELNFGSEFRQSIPTDVAAAAATHYLPPDRPRSFSVKDYYSPDYGLVD